jgi:predicted nucleic acid-binding protein
VIVVDASVVVEVFLQTPHALPISRKMFVAGETLHAPHLLDVEVTQVVCRFCRYGFISAERGAQAVGDLADFPVDRHSHVVLLPRVWQLRHALTAYDATYLALAEALDASLLTRDHALALAGSTVPVEVL